MGAGGATLIRRGGGAAAVAAFLLTSCALPRWPVEGPLTSPFGIRVRGFLPEIHRGVDIRVPEGTPVRAMKAGAVAHAGALGGYGLVVILDHGEGLRTVYAHLSEVTVQPGQRVSHRGLLGRAGSTGNATGPHLHFEVLRKGRAADPVPLLGGPPGR